jgi:hypothetical protein
MASNLAIPYHVFLIQIFLTESNYPVPYFSDTNFLYQFCNRLPNSMLLNHAKELFIGWHLRYPQYATPCYYNMLGFFYDIFSVNNLPL